MFNSLVRTALAAAGCLAMVACGEAASPAAMQMQSDTVAPGPFQPSLGPDVTTTPAPGATPVPGPGGPMPSAPAPNTPPGPGAVPAESSDAGPGMVDAGTDPLDGAIHADADQPETPMEVACPEEALAAGDESASLMHDGVRREFLIHVPAGYDNTRAVPLVLNFHGATSNARQQRELFSKMDSTADDKGFIVVYPEGIGSSWNAGACCGDAASRDVDDVGFARAIVAYMAEHACIDPRRVYATGFSNGGRMSYRLGCEAADVFAAIAPVAGTKSFPDLNNSPGCQPARPLSLIDFMGSADSRIAAQPGQVAEWVAFNGCSDAAPSEVYRNGNHYCEAYSDCDDGTSVTFCVVDGGGHCWPGSYPCPLGSTSRADELSANELMWQLFERSSL